MTFADDFVTIYHGDAWELAPTLESQSVNCIVTSPPYWGLRDYGTPGQFGLEPTPEAYVARLVELFALLRPALRDDGTVWLNLGDSYASMKGNPGPNSVDEKQEARRGWRRPQDWHIDGLKPKDLVGIPWMVAFALRADGWYLRSDIIWHKPNPMPESVTDRPTKAHEYLFLLSKSPRYYYDAEAIKEEGTGRTDTGRMTSPARLNQGGEWKRDKQRGHGRRHAGFNDRWDAMTREEQTSLGRNKRSVWSIATQPFAAAHFATFPPDLIKPCILAGCPPAGKRCDCDEIIATPTGEGAVDDPSMTTGRAGMNRPRRAGEGSRPITRREQRGHAEQMRTSPHRAEMERECGAAFAHYIRTDKSGARPLPPDLLASFTERGWLLPVPPCDHPIEPAGTVLDPFMGSGTTAQVARSLGRKTVGFELNADYIGIAVKHRLGQGVLL